MTAAVDGFGFGEVMTATPNFASGALGAGAGDVAPASSTGPFVLNLCSSTTPMALAQTDLAELKRFTFFVSRRFEEGRERFRLHMGYFATLAEAEEWLNVVREIYPGAWAGEAPGKKLRERAAAAQASQAQHAAGPQQRASVPRPPPAPRAPPAPVPDLAPIMLAPPPPPRVPDELSARVPVLKAAPALTRSAPAMPKAAAAVAPPAAKAAPPITATPPRGAPAARPAPVAARPTPPRAAPPLPQMSAAPVRAPAPAPAGLAARPAAPRMAPAAATRTPQVDPRTGRTGAFGDSNVREVLKALGDASATGETRLMRAPAAPPPAPATQGPAVVKSNLSDTQVLKMLEQRRPDGAGTAADPAHGAIPLLKPDDTGTREALKEAVTSDAPVLFAVQLQWSVQAVELDRVPPLAIFSAYTLYTVEGSRDGRKWFGLRLGFFSDAISAKQVAHYVRSEFTSVAVVPVSPQEKARATDQDKLAATLNNKMPSPAAPVDEFKLIDDDTAKAEVARMQAGAGAAAPGAGNGAAARKIPGRPVPRVAVGRAVTQASPPPAPAAGPAAGRARPAAKTAGRAGARDKRGAQSLEETLEILGASQLTIDDGTRETLNESGVRHLRVEVHKNSPFSKLLERLSERMKKS